MFHNLFIGTVATRERVARRKQSFPVAILAQGQNS